MKIKFHRTDEAPGGYTTIGYWRWSLPNNKGTLLIEVRKMKSFAHEIAVWGHEILEAAWCKLRGITTEECDLFDDLFEREYEQGKWPKSVEGGFDPRCPYRVGHIMGAAWEYFWVYLTCGLWWGWRGYMRECDQLLGITE